MTQLYDSEIERTILRFLSESPYHLQIASLDKSYFYVSEHEKLFYVMHKYFEEFRRPLTKDVFEPFLLRVDIRDKERSEVTLLYQEIGVVSIDSSQFDFFVERLEDLKVGREIKTIHDTLGTNLSKDRSNFREVLQNLTTQTIRLSSRRRDAVVDRGFLWEDIKDRWKEFEYREAHPDEIPGMPYGILELDELTGGIRKTHVVLFYGKTASGKSRILSNVSLNLARSGYTVMFIALEMSRRMLAKCMDSREALLNFTALDKGRLSRDEKREYFKQLKKQKKEQIPLYIVDIPQVIRPTDVAREVELFYHTHNYMPDVIALDYANLMESDRKYSGRSEKYDYIFQDLHRIARFYDIGLVTAAQEKRGSTQAKKKDEDEDTSGVENIGVSNYIAPHCELVARLRKDKFDEIENTLQLDIDKNRYGKQAISMTVFAAWAYNYIGDRHLKLHGERIS